MSKDYNKSDGKVRDELRKNRSEEEKMRKTIKCARPVTLALICDLTGYDIKPLNFELVIE